MLPETKIIVCSSPPKEKSKYEFTRGKKNLYGPEVFVIFHLKFFILFLMQIPLILFKKKKTW